MGKLAEIYKEQKQINHQYEAGPVPSLVTQQAEYLKFRGKKRAAERKFSYYRGLIMDGAYTLDQVLDAFEKAGGQQARAAKEKELERTYFYRNYWTKLTEEQPAIAEGLNEEQLNAISKKEEVAKEKIESLMAEGKLEPQAFQKEAGRFLIRLNQEFSLDPEVDLRVVEELEKYLSEEQKKSILDKFGAYQDPVNLPDEKKVGYPYLERTKELLEKMPAEIKSDPEKKAQYEQVLKFAGTHLTEHNEILRSEGLAVDNDIQAMEGAQDKYVRDVLRPAFQDGKYDGIYQKNDSFRDFRGIADEKRETFEELKKNGVQLSEKTKEGIRKMLRKMGEMGLEEYPHAPNGEDGDKIYGFNKLVAKKQELINAVKAGDAEKILTAGQEYEKTYHDMEDLYRISKEYFNQEPGLFPGNMDSIRFRPIPYAFTSDVQNTAFINSVFQTYINVKENNLNLEEYLANPVGKNLEQAEKLWEKNSFAKVSERVETLEDAIDLMTNVADFEDANQDLKEAVPMFGFGRQLNMPNMLESNPEFREKNNIVAYTLTNDMFNGAILGSEAGKFLYFHLSAKSPAEHQARLDTLRNLMLASDEDRKLNGIFAGLPETDSLGRKIGEGFQAEDYIAKTPVDYEGMIDRAKRIQNRAGQVEDAFNNTTWLNRKNSLEATRQLYTEVLLAHPEDAEKEGFKKMQAELDRTYDEIRKIDEGELGDRAAVNKAVMLATLKENRRKYLVENEPAQELRRLEREAVRTGDFSKYASFLTDVTARENDLSQKAYQEFSDYQDELVAKDGNGNFVKGLDFYRKLCHAVNEIDFEACISHSMKSEQLATRIRNGEVMVDPAFDEVKKDYHASRILANQILAGGEDDVRIQATTSLCTFLSDHSPRYETGEFVFTKDKEDQQVEFYDKGKIAGSVAERRRYLDDAQLGYTVRLGDENEDGSIKPLKQDDVTERLQKGSDKTLAYYQNLNLIKEQAREKLDAMKEARLGGRSGSDQYKAMYDSLEALTKLNANNTPGEIGQALENVRLSTQKYIDKIDDQIFANIREKGKNRYSFANELHDFAAEQILNMSQKVNGRLAEDEKLIDQINRAVVNLEEYQARQARPEDPAVGERLLNHVGNAVENPKKLNAQKEADFLQKAKESEEALHKMGPGLYKPEGRLWEEKMQAFVNVATAKEIERRGGLAAGETHHSVMKELFGKQEQREVVFDLLKKCDGPALIKVAESPKLKQKLEQQMGVKKNPKQDAPRPEEKMEEIKRRNTISFGPQ